MNRLLLRLEALLRRILIVEKHVDSHIDNILNSHYLLVKLKLLLEVRVRPAVFPRHIGSINLDHTNVLLHYFLYFLVLVRLVLLKVVFRLFVVL